jgi:hypothetical protein
VHVHSNDLQWRIEADCYIVDATLHKKAVPPLALPQLGGHNGRLYNCMGLMHGRGADGSPEGR